MNDFANEIATLWDIVTLHVAELYYITIIFDWFEIDKVTVHLVTRSAMIISENTQ